MSRTRIGVLWGAVAIGVAAGLGDAAQAQMIGIDFLGGVREIDLSTGQATLIGNTGLTGWNSMALGPSGALWSSIAGDDDTPTRLYTIDAFTGQATLQLELVSPMDLRGMAWTDDGDLVGVRDAGIGTPDSLVRIDTVTGGVTTLATFAGFTRIQGIETTPDGDLVMWDLDAGILRTLDDGTMLEVMTPDFSGSQTIQSLAYGADGMLYASSGSTSSPQPFGQGGLYRIDAVTWEPEFIGAHGFPFDLRGMANIPSAGSGAMMLMGGVLAGRRRR